MGYFFGLPKFFWGPFFLGGGGITVPETRYESGGEAGDGTGDRKRKRRLVLAALGGSICQTEKGVEKTGYATEN